jgi:hypothetical protein
MNRQDEIEPYWQNEDDWLWMIEFLARLSGRLHRTTDYATVLLPLPGISNDLEVVRLL